MYAIMQTSWCQSGDKDQEADAFVIYNSQNKAFASEGGIQMKPERYVYFSVNCSI
jgi:hypothetical protein